MQQEFFVITRVSRDDLESRGYDATNLSDEAMTKIASKMGDSYVGSGAFWDDLDNVCDNFEVPKTIR